jgi:LytS/YehU family sensor histidine kinase
MNPQFIFNSLNSIHKYIWENKPEDASEYLTKFSKLVRLILENSKEKELPLSKELESLRLYIELEHRRCNHKFDYSITVDPAVITSNVLVPSMILQPYVENAIWHGLVQKTDRGNLSINISNVDGELLCVIEDNGIGRKRAEAIKAQRQDNYQSLGLNITQERLHLLSRESGSNATVQIIDLEKDNTTGTKVILYLPLNTVY